MEKTGGTVSTSKAEGPAAMGSQLPERKGTMTQRVNVWGQKTKIIKGKEKKETGQRGTCALRCFICSGCRGRITSLRQSRRALLPNGGIHSLPPSTFCMRMRGCFGWGALASGSVHSRGLSAARRAARPLGRPAAKRPFWQARRMGSSPPASPANACAWVSTTSTTRGLMARSHAGS